MRHFDIVDIITEGIHSDERGNLEIDEYNCMFHNILNVHNTISKNYNMINNGLHNLHRKLETRHPLKTGLRSDFKRGLAVPSSRK